MNYVDEVFDSCKDIREVMDRLQAGSRAARLFGNNKIASELSDSAAILYHSQERIKRAVSEDLSSTLAKLKEAVNE